MLHHHPRRLRFAVLLGILFLGTGPAPAENWPRFRGANGTGIAADKDIPIKWSAKENILWQVRLPGLGNSSPIVWGDRLFVQSAQANGKDRLLVCLKVADGSTLWSRSVPGTKVKKHPFNTYASSTPATDGERVYALFWDGGNVVMHAYDFNGNPVWNRDLGPFTSQHGAGASPIVYKDKVILNNDQDGKADVLALSARTGKPLWQSNRKAFRASYSTPFLLDRANDTPELIVTSTEGVAGLNPDNGSVNWHWSGTLGGAKMPMRTCGSSVFCSGLILACSGEGGGPRHTVAIRAGGKGDVTETHLAWENKKTFPYVPSPLAWGNHIYFVNDRGDAACHVAKTGKMVWSTNLGAKFKSSPVLIDGKIYAASEEGDVFVFAAAAQFRLLAKNTVGEAVIASPAVANGRLFIRTANQLVCIGKTPGA
jgi:outer membrane protein assembly factor BamB